MKPLFLIADSDAATWFIFGGILVGAVVLAVLLVWIGNMGGHHHKRRRKRRHKRHANPSLAETEGLPPMRAPDEPPKGM